MRAQETGSLAHRINQLIKAVDILTVGARKLLVIRVCPKGFIGKPPDKRTTTNN